MMENETTFKETNNILCEEYEVCNILRECIENMNIDKEIFINFIRVPLYSFSNNSNLIFEECEKGIYLTLNNSAISLVLNSFHFIQKKEDRIKLTVLTLQEYLYEEILSYFIKLIKLIKT